MYNGIWTLKPTIQKIKYNPTMDLKNLIMIVVCPFVHFLLAIVLSVLLRFTESDYPFVIFKLFFLHYQCKVVKDFRIIVYKNIYGTMYINNCDRINGLYNTWLNFEVPFR